MRRTIIAQAFEWESGGRKTRHFTDTGGALDTRSRILRTPETQTPTRRSALVQPTGKTGGTGASLRHAKPCELRLLLIAALELVHAAAGIDDLVLTGVE